MDILDLDETGMNEILEILDKYGVLKFVNSSKEIENHEEEVDSLEPNDYYRSRIGFSASICFNFVGVIIVKSLVLMVYPKYIEEIEEEKLFAKFQTILKVIDKYKGKKSLKIIPPNETREIKADDTLSLILYLLEDYFTYGVYENYIRTNEVDGNGLINWNKTINDNTAFVADKQVIYPHIYTMRNRTNISDLITRIHKWIITKCSSILEETKLLDLLGITNVTESFEELEDIGNIEKILLSLKQELNIQFITRKQNLLKAMYMFIANLRNIDFNNRANFFGISNFNLVWEDVCASALNNKLKTHINELEMKVPLAEKYNQYNYLIDIIEKPKWTYTEMNASDTLKPDLIAIDNVDDLWCFSIYDAKYYTPELQPDKVPSGQPGIESISKQYLYQLAYADFIREHEFDKVENCFLFPSDLSEMEVRGEARMDMLNNLGLVNIKNIFVPADNFFRLYLDDRVVNSKFKL